MFRSSAPPASVGSAGVSSRNRGPSGTVITGPIVTGPIIPGTAPVPDFNRGARAQTPRRDPREQNAVSLRRLNKCMFLEYDEKQERWRDALNRTGRQPTPPVALKPRREPAREELVAKRRESAGSLPPLPMGPPIWENPLVIGLLLAVCPPIGVTLAWSARSVPHAGRVALTMFGAFVMLTATLVACVMLTGA